ncbi:LPS-assembly lipoprotein LptE [Thioalkalivibrio sp. HK1]|uniref:LPS-assembly lipoprotein LptE n=1 Tax=Thioalkalivibrio sp. HK1 TaxID=1469245 RepID=UPI000472ECC6|nr:LPS assembly lipoprotein LptE [Thioalkalivibrio sp. HK1]
MPIEKPRAARQRTMRFSNPPAPALRRRSAALVGVLIAALLCTGCGYALRGFEADRGLDIEAMRVSGPDAIRSDIVGILEGMGVATDVVTDTATQNRIPHLQILDERCHRENLIIDIGSGKERDFAVVCRLRFRLIGIRGEAIIPSQILSLRRESRHDPQRLLATEWEESTLRDDIRRDAAAGIVRRVQAAWAAMRAQGDAPA